MERLQITATFTIHPGKEDEFRAIARKLLEITREKERGKGGTLQYDWFLSKDGRQGFVRETYASSDALLAHLANVGPLLGAITQIGSLEVDVFGAPSEQLLAAVAGMPLRVHSYLQGLDD